jgi:hypothetical protein
MKKFWSVLCAQGMTQKLRYTNELTWSKTFPPLAIWRIIVLLLVGFSSEQKRQNNQCIIARGVTTSICCAMLWAVVHQDLVESVIYWLLSMTLLNVWHALWIRADTFLWSSAVWCNETASFMNEVSKPTVHAAI